MGSVKHQNHQTNISNSQLVPKLVGSVLLFLVMLLCSSLFSFIFSLMHLLGCMMGKNYMFLLFNGILVLIVKNSGLITNSQPHETYQVYGESREMIAESRQKSLALSEDKNVAMEVKEAEEMEHKSLTVDIAYDQQRIDNAIDGEEEEEEQEEVGLLSAEELNKKCDDFIRKMKEEIKYEARQDEA